MPTQTTSRSADPFLARAFSELRLSYAVSRTVIAPGAALKVHPLSQIGLLLTTNRACSSEKHALLQHVREESLWRTDWRGIIMTGPAHELEANQVDVISHCYGGSLWKSDRFQWNGNWQNRYYLLSKKVAFDGRASISQLHMNVLILICKVVANALRNEWSQFVFNKLCLIMETTYILLYSINLCMLEKL